MNISTLVFECREQETRHRHISQPVPDPRTKSPIFFLITQSSFGKIDWANSSQDVLIDFVRRVELLLIIRSFSRDVVVPMDQTDQVAARAIISFDNSIICLLYTSSV